MTTLVTGGAGFVGLNVAEALLDAGEHVLLSDRAPPPAAACEALARRPSALALRYGDVLDDEFVASLFRAGRIRRVVHCAAVTSGPRREAEAPGRIIDVNLKGTAAVLAAARDHGVERFVYVGSGAAYGESLYALDRLTEDAPCVPQTLYGITKFAAERACLRLAELWHVDATCVRLGTVIGPWERDTGVRDNYGTHTQLAALAACGEAAILPPREVQRDWVYARDVAAGVLALLDAPAPRHRVYNLASGAAWPHAVARWCAALAAVFPRFAYRLAREDEQPNVWYTDRDRGIMDTGRIERDLGFRASYGMEAAYADFIAWITRHPDFYRPAAQ